MSESFEYYIKYYHFVLEKDGDRAFQLWFVSWDQLAVKSVVCPIILLRFYVYTKVSKAFVWFGFGFDSIGILTVLVCYGYGKLGDVVSLP